MLRRASEGDRATLVRAIDLAMNSHMGGVIDSAVLQDAVRSDINADSAWSLLLEQDRPAAVAVAVELMRAQKTLPPHWIEPVQKELIEAATETQFKVLIVNANNFESWLNASRKYQRLDLFLAMWKDLPLQTAAGKPRGIRARLQRNTDYVTSVIGDFLNSKDAAMRMRLLEFWPAEPRVKFSYDRHWRTFSTPSRRVYSQLLIDSDISVQRAALKQFIERTDNPEALPDGVREAVTDDEVRAAAAKLLPQLEDARPNLK
jgi:hypothetical protein